MTAMSPAYGVDVTVGNPRTTSYLGNITPGLVANETTDGSIRFIVDAITTGHGEIQLRTSGVWNTTGLTLSGASLLLGRELTQSAFGEFIETYDAGDDTRQLHPHIHYSDAGTLETGYFPNLGAEYDNVVQPIDTDQIVFSDKIVSYLITNQSAQISATFKAGATPPTGNVVIEAYRDKPVADSLYYYESIPQSTFDVPDGTEITITYTSKLQANDGETVVLRLLTDDGSDMSLRGDSASGDWYLANRQQDMVEDPIMTFAMLDRISVDNNSEVTIDNSGNIVYGNVTY